MIIGDQLRALREQQNLSQGDIALGGVNSRSTFLPSKCSGREQFAPAPIDLHLFVLLLELAKRAGLPVHAQPHHGAHR